MPVNCLISLNHYDIPSFKKPVGGKFVFIDPICLTVRLELFYNLLSRLVQRFNTAVGGARLYLVHLTAWVSNPPVANYCITLD